MSEQREQALPNDAVNKLYETEATLPEAVWRSVNDEQIRQSHKEIRGIVEVAQGVPFELTEPLTFVKPERCVIIGTEPKPEMSIEEMKELLAKQVNAEQAERDARRIMYGEE